jgi:hypothetical protein
MNSETGLLLAAAGLIIMDVTICAVYLYGALTDLRLTIGQLPVNMKRGEAVVVEPRARVEEGQVEFHIPSVLFGGDRMPRG